MLSRRACSRAAVLILIVVLPALAPSPATAAPVGDCQAGAGWAESLPAPAARVVELVNGHRAGLGLAPLAVSPTLSAAAVWKARHMATYRYLAHDDPAPPVQRTSAQRAQACGYPAAALIGENIAMGQSTPESVMGAWLGSGGHRANIERASFSAIGVGAARSASGSVYWAQVFGSVADPGASVPQPPPPPPTPAPSPTPGTIPPAAPAPTAGAAAALRVRGCERSSRRRRSATCRVLLRVAPVTLRGRLLRGGKIVARGVVRARTVGVVRLRLSGRKALAPGRRVLRLRVGETILRRSVRLR